MSNTTILQQGEFTATAAPKRLVIRSDVDWMHVWNYTNIATPANEGLEFYWQRGMADGRGFIYSGTGGTNTLALTWLGANAGFKLLDTSASPIGNAVALTSTTDDPTVEVSTGTTSGIVAGDVVRLSSIEDVPNICSLDFQIANVVGATSFEFAYNLANAPGSVGGTGYYRRIKYDPIYYPRRRYVIDATPASSMVVTCSVDHGFTVGQRVRLKIPSEFSMVEADGLLGTITTATDNTLTLDIDSSSFTAFTFPTTTNLTTPAQVIPIGMDTSEAISGGVDLLADATYNDAFIGMELAPGSNSPGGLTGDKMYWIAGKSFSVNNE